MIQRESLTQNHLYSVKSVNKILYLFSNFFSSDRSSRCVETGVFDWLLAVAIYRNLLLRQSVHFIITHNATVITT